MKPVPLDDITLDRLTEGELSRDDLRRVLAQCEATPALWRQVALAFLEAQAWRQDLPAAAIGERGAKGAFAVDAPRSAVHPHPHPPSTTTIPWSNAFWLTAAAVVFLLSWVAGQRFWSGSPSTPQTPAVAAVGAGDPKWVDVGRAQEDTTIPPPVANVQLSWQPQDGGNRGQVTVPVFDSDEVDAEELWQASARSLDAALRQIDPEQRRVVREYQFVPVALQDGRRAVIPIESVQWVQNVSY